MRTIIKKGTSQVIVVAFVQSSLASRFLFLTAFSFSFLLISFISKKSHRSFIVRTRAPSLLFTSTIYISVYRIVWSSLVNANRHLIICLSIDVHVSFFSPKNRRNKIEKTSQWENRINRTSLNCHLFDDVDHYASP